MKVPPEPRICIDDILNPSHAADQRRKELDAGIGRIDLELARIAQMRQVAERGESTKEAI